MRPLFFFSRVKPEKGMTLVEVMMAVTIFAIIFVAVAGAFFSGVKLWGRISKVDVPAMFVALDMHRLSKDLRQALDIPLIGFQGSSRELYFPAIDGGRVVTLMYAFDPEKKELLRKVYAFDPQIKVGAEQDVLSITKVAAADTLNFSYLDRAGQEPEWLDSWSKEQGLLRALRVEGVFKGEPFTKIIILPQA
jgi:prepilin-type N-terminal cleavage/methylation domain-containing protein